MVVVALPSPYTSAFSFHGWAESSCVLNAASGGHGYAHTLLSLSPRGCQDPQDLQNRTRAGDGEAGGFYESGSNLQRSATSTKTEDGNGWLTDGLSILRQH